MLHPSGTSATHICALRGIFILDSSCLWFGFGLIFNPNRDILRIECLYESALIANTQLIYRVLSTCLSFGYCYLVRSTAKASHGSSNSNLTMFLSWTTDRSIRHY